MGLENLVKQPLIEVIMPTYNGILYLTKQIDSIYNQTLKAERLILRDDCSCDGTEDLIRDLKQHYGKWLHVLPADGNIGCIANVNLLLKATVAPYVAIADQDDIWLLDKLERSFTVLQSLEACYDPIIPILVHSDLALVNEAGNPMGFSYMQRQRLNPSWTKLPDLIITNVVTGCTVMANRSLLNKSLPIPSKALMHDWWLALVASGFGLIEFLPYSTVQYRQHGGNLIGAKGVGIHYLKKRLCSLKLLSDGLILQKAIIQAIYFEHRYGLKTSQLIPLMNTSRLKRIANLFGMLKLGLPRKHGILRTIGLYILLVCTPKVKTEENC